MTPDLDKFFNLKEQKMAEGEKPSGAPAPPIEPLPVTFVGVRTDNTGAPLVNGQVITTPDHQPNIVVQVVTPVLAVLIRFANAYLTAIVGLLVGGPATGLITAGDLWHLLLKCASLALFGPVVAALKDIVTILTGLERKFPIATGNV